MSVKLIGTLSYDPKRDKVEFKKTHKMRTLIVNVRPGNLAQYYEKLIQDEFGPWAILRAPMFGYHVTVISGNEHVPNMNAWKKYEGKKIEVEYEIETLRKDRSFWNFRVSGTDQLREIRRELGLKPDYHFHLTIGREDTNYRIRELSSDDFEKLFDMIPVVGGNQELVKDLLQVKVAKKHNIKHESAHDVIQRHIPNPMEAGKEWERKISSFIMKG